MTTNRRINGQFDDGDDEYRVEVLVPDGPFSERWERVANNVTWRNAQLIARRYPGQATKVRHNSEY